MALNGNVASMRARLGQLELRRGALMKEIEDRQREISEIERDGRILALALDESEKPDEEHEDPVKPDQEKS